MNKKDVILKLIERGKKYIITDKFATHSIAVERDWALRAWEIFAIGTTLGETLGSVEFPTYWSRFLKRKDCPKYMREISISYINAYYPKLSLPEEKNWVTFERPVPKDE